MFGYDCNIGVSLVLDAELQALIDGLKMTGEERVCQLFVESNSKTMIDLILGTERVGIPLLGLEI